MSPEATEELVATPPTAHPVRRRRGWASPFRSVRAASVFAAALAALVFANSLRNDFAYDDVRIVPDNPDIQSLHTLPQLLLAPYWPGEYGKDLGLWRPGTVGVLGLEWAAWGNQPVLFHLVNVLAHAVATALVVLLVARLATVPAAFLAGLLFAVHPVHAEAVANVVGLAEVLSAILFLGACLVHLGASRSRYGGLRLVGVALLYLLAFSVKESAVTLPAALFLLDAARERLGLRDLPDYLRRRWPVYVLLAAVAGGMLLLRFSVLGSIASPMAPLGAELLTEGVPRIWTLGEIWSHYVRLLVFPVDLSVDYSPGVIPIALGWNALAVSGALLALGILALALWSWRSPPMGKGRTTRRILGFGVVWFLVTVSPVSNVLFISGVLLAERTLYLPSVGFVAMVGWGLVELARRRRRLTVALTAVVVTLMAVRTWGRNPTWHDNLTVFGTLIHDYPQSGRSQWVLGDLFYQEGRLPEALKSYRLAISILGGHYELLTEVGKKLMNAGHEEAAIHLLDDAWREHPELSEAPTFLAVSELRRGAWRETERYGKAAAALNPDNAVMAHAVAEALTHQGKLAEAVRWRERTLALGENQHWQQWIALADLELALGDTARAQVARDSALARATTRLERARVDSLYAPLPFTGAPLQDSSQLQDARPEAPPPGVLPGGQ